MPALSSLSLSLTGEQGSHTLLTIQKEREREGETLPIMQQLALPPILALVGTPRNDTLPREGKLQKIPDFF